MRKILLATAAAVMLLASCATTGNVKFTEARNYFVGSDVDNSLTVIKATSQQELEKYFGMATTMGKNGRPTVFDFSKEFALCVTMPVSNGGTEIKPISLKQTGDKELTITYSIHKGSETGYSIKPMFLLKIPNKYKDYTVKEQRIEQ